MLPQALRPGLENPLHLGIYPFTELSSERISLKCSAIKLYLSLVGNPFLEAMGKPLDVVDPTP
jgi:hypothetical protein